MKRLYIPAVLLAMSSLGVNAQKIATANKIVDCGQVMFRSPVTAEFEITNKGGRALWMYVQAADARMWNIPRVTFLRTESSRCA